MGVTRVERWLEEAGLVVCVPLQRQMTVDADDVLLKPVRRRHLPLARSIAWAHATATLAS